MKEGGRANSARALRSGWTDQGEWVTGWPPGVDWSIEPSSLDLRRNLYRTLMKKMHADGLLGTGGGRQ